MTSFIDTFSRDVTCAAGAALITLVLGLAFVESTAVAPGMQREARHILALQPQHAWFGQPEPAVLVD